ncbi:hypothetical protein KAJ27_16445 [bacterium]|nr:hypothetical protein [bacterium]
MDKKKKGIPGWVIVLIMLFFGGLFFGLLGGLDSATKESVGNAQNFLKKAKRKFQKSKSELIAEIKASDVLKEYSEKENWNKNLDGIEQELLNAEKIMNKDVLPTLEKNDSELKNIIVTGVKKIFEICREQSKNLDQLNNRKKAFSSMITNLGKNKKKYNVQLKSMKNELVKNGNLNNRLKMVVKLYPKKKNILIKEWTILKNKYKEELKLYKSFKKEAEIESPDYANLLDLEKQFKKTRKEFQKTHKNLSKNIDELNTAFDRILADMKHKESFFIEYAVYGNSETPKNVSTSQVSSNVYKGSYVNQVVRSGEWNDTCVDAMWKEYKFYHKYKDIKNGKSELTKWIPVSDDVYERNIENLGMVVENKPKGFYMSESTCKIVPPGYSYLNNSKYGSWKKKNGKKVWVSLPEYEAQIDALYEDETPEMDYEDYDLYIHHRGPYYGRPGRLRWGSRGSWTNKRFGRTHFIKRGGTRTYSSRQFRGKGGRFGK